MQFLLGYPVLIQAVDHTSPHLAAVKKLWRANSDTLGFLPDGAFDERARAKQLLVALNDAGDCVGYLLWRRSKGKASIIHLCAANQTRRQGCASALVRRLIELTKHLRSIDLRCRRDYAEANRFWQRLGFCARDEIAGRSADGSELTCWRLDHGHPDLFSTVEPAKLDAGIDASVFFNLIEPPGLLSDEESRALLADWLQPLVRIRVSGELLNDINRGKDRQTRSARRVDAQLFDEMRCTADAFDTAKQKLTPHFPDQKSEQDESDFRHLVRTLAAGVSVFVTRDEGLLAKTDDVYAAFGLSILRPAELIGRIDELVREREYQRLQVAGTNQVFCKRLSSASTIILDQIQASDRGERKAAIRDVVQSCLAQPHKYSCWGWTNCDGKLLSFYVRESTTNGIVRVPVFRVCSDWLAGTLARSVLTGLAYDVARTGGQGLLISDSNLDDAVHAACNDLGYLAVESGRFKLVLTDAATASDLSRTVISTAATADIKGSAVDQLSSILASSAILNDPQLASQTEHVLWPAKITDSKIPCFIVPIRPDYAQHLFDENLARQMLIGAEPELALNPESVYYRAAKPAILSGPGRILWYVSNKGKFDGTMRIRACSRIEEVAVDKPKTLFKRFRRLGVYEWSEVFATAKQDIDAPIMAVRFHDTELLERPVVWDDFQSILRKHDVKTNLQSPAAIPQAAFNEIYSAGRTANATAVDTSAVRSEDIQLRKAN